MFGPKTSIKKGKRTQNQISHGYHKVLKTIQIGKKKLIKSQVNFLAVDNSSAAIARPLIPKKGKRKNATEGFGCKQMKAHDRCSHQMYNSFNILSFHQIRHGIRYKKVQGTHIRHSTDRNLLNHLHPNIAKT